MKNALLLAALTLLAASAAHAQTSFNETLPPDIDTPVVLAGGNNYARVEGSNIGTISGNISGGSSATLNKLGSGTLRLTGINDYGSTNIDVGILSITHNRALGNTTGTTGTTIRGGVFLRGGALSIDAPMTLNNRMEVAAIANATSRILNGSNLTITGNPLTTQGVGILIAGTLVAHDVTYYNNVVSSGNVYGAAVYLNPSAYFDGTGSTFDSNVTPNRPGAAVGFSRGGTLILTDANIHDNRSGNGGAIWVDGGTTLVLGASAGKTSSFRNNTFYAAPASTMSISWTNRDAYTTTMSVITGLGGLLDMLDPMRSDAPAAGQTGTIINATKTGLGEWRLGGISNMAGIIRISVNEGLFSLYQNAQLNFNYGNSLFTVNNGGTFSLNTSSSLSINNATNTRATFATGSVLHLTGTSGNATLNAPAINFDKNSTIRFDLSSTATQLNIAGNGSLTFNSTNIDINPTAIGSATATLIDISAFTGTRTGFAIDKFNLTLRGESIAQSANPRLQNAGLTLSGDTLAVTYDYQGAANVTWTGNVNSAWDIATSNWNGTLTANGAQVTQFFHGDTVSFDDSSNPANRNITIAAGGVAVAGMTVSGNANYTFSGGSIDGPGALLKQGAGTLTLNNANLYTGGTTIEDGTLVASNINALGAGTVVNNASLVFDINTAGSGSLTNIIQGNGTLEKKGNGSLIINNDISNSVAISAGSLIAAKENFFTVPGSLSVASGATFVLGGASQKIDTIQNNGLIEFSFAPDSISKRSAPISLNVANYSSTGAITVVAHLDAANSWVDSLNITGTASGTTAVNIVNINDKSSAAPDAGIAIVNAPDSTPDGTFTIGTTQGAGFFLYKLDPVISGSTKQWLLHNSGYSLAMGFATASRLATQAAADTLLQRQGELSEENPKVGDVWARYLYRQDSVSMPELSQLKVKTTVIQAGIDLVAAQNGSSSRWNAGLLFDATSSDLDLIRPATGNADIYGLGFYATYINKKSYANLLIKGLKAEYTLKNPTNKLETDGKGLAATLEYGRNYPFYESWTLEPQLQADFFWQDIDSTTDNEGSNYSFDISNTTRFRVGIKLGGPIFNTATISGDAYVRFSIAYSLQSDDRSTVNRNTGVENMENAAGIFEAGTQLRLGKATCLYANGLWQAGDKCDSFALSGGLRFIW